MTLTMTDLFCGAGGSSTGGTQVPGVTVRMAANHWRLAVDTHNANHPNADHDCADLSQVDPRRYPHTDLLWASPECTNHSQARGRRRAEQQGNLFDPLPDAAAERSRATMWDVVRFTEVHRYRAVIVENVVESAWWAPFHAWLMAMDALGYDHHRVYLNSMHAQRYGLPAPQSRDRQYVVFWRRGEHAPDLTGMQRPPAWCPSCEQVVPSVQSWKRPDRKWGRYRAQYHYRCPHTRCRNTIVEPGWLPAAAAIDWSIPGQRIGDRARPLAPKTLARIQAGIDRYWAPIHLEAAGNTYDAAAGKPGSYLRTWPLDEVFRTMHTTASKALAYPPLTVPVEGREGKVASTALDPYRTMTTRNETGLAFVAELRGGRSDARAISDPLAAVTAGGNHHALVMRGESSDSSIKPAAQPIGAVTASGSQFLLVPTGGTWRERATPSSAPFPTRTTRETDGLAEPAIDLGDVRFRMLEPHEIVAAMAFPTDYIMYGTKRERVRMAGNAVTPPAARDLIATVATAITGEVAA